MTQKKSKEKINTENMTDEQLTAAFLEEEIAKVIADHSSNVKRNLLVGTFTHVHLHDEITM